MTSLQTKPLAFGTLLLASSFCAGEAAIAQAASYPPGAVVQSLQEDAGSALARHLRDLNTSPRNLSSLLGAGNAALEVGDPRSALTFFARAEEVAPRDGRVKAGMGSAFVQTEQAQAALKFFADAVSMGAPLSSFAKDRGLAYDMIGENARAQVDYMVALQRGSDPEVERRLALSKAIAGDKEGALAVLAPQLARYDRAGLRARAFVLALTGDAVGASQAVAAVMPAQANAMRPFLARLPLLGPADRAMAVHFGHFPRDPQAFSQANVQYAQAQPVAPVISAQAQGAQALTRPTPNARASSRRARQARAAQPVQIKAEQLPPQPVPGPPQVQPQQFQPQPHQYEAAGEEVQASVETAQLPPSSVALGQPFQAQMQGAAAEAPSTSSQSASASAESFDFGDVIEAVQSLPSPTEAAQPLQLAEVAKPAPAKPAAAKSAPKAKAAPAKPQEPSRIWVQVAAAQDKNAFPFEFKRLQKKAAKLLAGKTAWTAPLGKTNRLLVGPFKTEAEARDLVNELSKVEISSYSWISDAGQKIDKLPAK